MKLKAQVSGLQDVIGRLKKVDRAVAIGTEKGLKESGLRNQRHSQKLVPVDTSFLKGSAYTRVSGRGMKTEVETGYTAEYALWVHEMTDMKLKGKKRSGGKGRYWDPQGRAHAKFLEQPFRENGPITHQTVRDRIKAELIAEGIS